MIQEDKVANKEDDVDGARIGVDYATKVEFIGEKEDSVESTCTSSKKWRRMSQVIVDVERWCDGDNINKKGGSIWNGGDMVELMMCQDSRF